jgi:hypothetical protein
VDAPQITLGDRRSVGVSARVPAVLDDGASSVWSARAAPQQEICVPLLIGTGLADFTVMPR